MNSLTPNADLATAARGALSGKWSIAVLAGLLFSVVIVVISIIPVIGVIVPIVISGPLLLGYFGVILSIWRNEETSPSRVFDGFHLFLNSFLLYLLTQIFIMLWSLLLVIPGIVAALSYSMAYFIMLDEPEISPMEAIRKSKAMMKGNRWKLLFMYLRFIGWWILCMFTFGIGYLWLLPYVATTKAAFYEDLKASEVQPESEPAPEAV